MTKKQWQQHSLEADLRHRAGGEIHDQKTCPDCAARRRTKRKNAYARSYYDAMRSVGMVKTPYGWE